MEPINELALSGLRVSACIGEMATVGDDMPLHGAELSLEQVMSSPLVHMVMQRDGLTPDKVWEVIRAAQRRMRAGVSEHFI